MQEKLFRQGETAWLMLLHLTKDVGAGSGEIPEPPINSEVITSSKNQFQSKAVGDTRRLVRDFTVLKLDSGQNPTEFTLRVDGMVQIPLVLRHVTPAGHAAVAIVSGTSEEYDTPRLILDCEKPPTREIIKRLVAQGYEWLGAEQTGSGRRALTKMDTREVVCQLRNRAGHPALQSRRENNGP